MGAGAVVLKFKVILGYISKCEASLDYIRLRRCEKQGREEKKAGGEKSHGGIDIELF